MVPKSVLFAPAKNSKEDEVTKATYMQMVRELRQEVENMVDRGHLNGLKRILRKYHPRGHKASSDAQVSIASELIRSAKNRGTFIPLGTLTTGRDAQNRYAEGGFLPGDFSEHFKE